MKSIGTSIRSWLLGLIATLPAAIQAGALSGPVVPDYKPKAPARKYPEQSSRQALRGQRRAQGGPGIVLIDGVYHRA